MSESEITMVEEQPLEVRATSLPPGDRRSTPYALHASSLSQSSRFSAPGSLTVTQASSDLREPESSYINIGVDFGTTYSGIAWAVSGTHPSEINVVTSWPDATTTNVKVPTEITYKNGLKWGYSVPSNVQPLKGFKLLLLHDEDMPPTIRNSSMVTEAKELLAKEEKSLRTVISDYLKLLWNRAMIDIQAQLGRVMDGLPFRIVVTVPAIWKTYAQEEMRRACQEAGLLETRLAGETRLEFVAEPEAAALATFIDRNYRRDLRIGDVIVICDAGGGTVDLVTYSVEKIEPAIKLAECVAGDAGLCGSMIIDNAFKAYMETLTGEGKLKKLPPDTYHELMFKWEHNIKRQYENNTREIVIPIPHKVTKLIKEKARYSIRNRDTKKCLQAGDNMKFGSKEIKDIFDPAMRDILTLINTQIAAAGERTRRKPKAILLVGGLGANKFLYQRLQAEYSAKDIDLLQPQGPRPWSAICRGAVIKGMSFDDYEDLPLPIVTSYVSKAHYGIAYKVPFDQDKHLEEDRRYDQATEQHLAFNQMQWYVKKGDDISQGDPVTMSWEKYQPESRRCTSFTVEILECESEEAPTRRTPDVVQHDIVSFPVDFLRLPAIEGAGGKRFRRAAFDLKMTMIGLGRLDFTVFMDGHQVGQKNVNVRLGNRVGTPGQA